MRHSAGQAPTTQEVAARFPAQPSARHGNVTPPKHRRSAGSPTKTPTHESYAESVDAITAATRTFCQAIEAGDFYMMQRLWERTRRVLCILPGRPITRGWNAVAHEWIRALWQPMEVFVENLSISIEGNIAWIAYDCDLVTNTHPALPCLRWAHATTYSYDGSRWLIVAHHASVTPTEVEPLG